MNFINGTKRNRKSICISVLFASVLMMAFMVYSHICISISFLTLTFSEILIDYHTAILSIDVDKYWFIRTKKKVLSPGHSYRVNKTISIPRYLFSRYSYGLSNKNPEKSTRNIIIFFLI